MSATASAETLDVLDLAEGMRLAIVATATGLAALPQVHAGGGWRRAVAGDGVAEALLAVLTGVDGEGAVGAFTLRTWTADAVCGERAIGVDQTNESVIVGDAAVVKWATHLQEGPHPAPPRIAALRAAGFTGMPAPWGLVVWHPPHAEPTLAAAVDEYVAGAVDGWTWAVESITAAASSGDRTGLVTATGHVGRLVADMHAGLAGTAVPASADDARRWRADAFDVLDTVCGLADSVSVALVKDRRADVADVLDVLGTLPAAPVLDGHGDLHVGQVLRAGSRFVVTDFDGNPVLPASRRALPIPAALDVAGMAQSLAHVAIVARTYADLEPGALAAADAAGREAFLGAYVARLGERGYGGLYDPGQLHALRLQQVLREIVYAARHLPRWMYVPDAALPALLDEGIRS